MAATFVRVSGICVQPMEQTVYGRQTTLGARFKIGRHARVVCRCSCGKYSVVFCSNLLRADDSSCGCATAEANRKAKTTHGESAGGKWTPEYAAWCSMIQRVSDENTTCADNYIARGIVACCGFREYMTFLESVGRKPTPLHSLDRIGNNGNYSCGHCEQCVANGWPMNIRWATKVEQNNNTRKNHMMTFYGKTMSRAQWSLISQVHQQTIGDRLRAGWTEKDAVWTPVDKQRASRRRFANKPKVA